MPIEKKKRKVFTFNSSTDATIFKKYCEDNSLPGRIIPVPRTISATCGSSFMILENEFELFSNHLENLKYEGIFDVLL